MLKLVRLFCVGSVLLWASVACQVIDRFPFLSTGAANSRPSASTLELFVLPEAGSKPVLDLLNGAQKSIRMTMYLLSDRDVIEALKSARGRGVDVRVLLEAQPSAGASGNQQTIKDLQSANVSVRTGNPAFRRTHEKAIVVDDRTAIIMTFNCTRPSFTTNRGYGIIDSNLDEVTEIINVFEADWKRIAPTMTNPKLVWSPVNTRQRFLDLISGATKTLEIEMEEMQDKQIEDAIVSVAQRGVQVRVVMSPAADANKDPNTKGLEKLKSAGAQVRLVKTPYIHTKMMIVDNARALVGSATISTASLDANRELGILVADPKIIQTLSATFASDWNIGK